MQLQISYKKQFLLFILLFLILISAIEGILRIYEVINPRCNLMENEVSKNWDYDVKIQICNTWITYQRHIDPISNIKSGEPNQHFPNMDINSHGFRGPEIQKEKPDETFRIFVVGGSTTFGIRAFSDQQTIPGYLQESFDNLNLDKKIEVVNAGISSVTSTDELQLIRTKIIQFDNISP